MHNFRFATGLIVTLALLAAAPSAFADTLCVNTDPAGCDLTYGAGQLQGALNEAAAASEADTVRIGAGTYTGAFTYNSASNSDTIEGVGQDTKVRAPQNAIALSLGSAGSTVRNLTLESGQDGSTAIAITAGTLRDAWITTSPGVINARAAQLSGSETLVDNVVASSNASSLGIVTQGAGSPAIEDSSVAGASVGIEARTGSSPNVRRTRIEGADSSAIHALSSSINVSDSLVLLGSGDTGLFADDNGDLATRSASIIADRVTVAALPGATGTTGSFSQSSSSGDQMWMWLKNSVLAGIDRPYRCQTGGGQTLL